MRFKTEGAGKGDKQRPVDRERYEKNYEAIYGKDYILKARKSFEEEGKMLKIRRSK